MKKLIFPLGILLVFCALPVLAQVATGTPVPAPSPSLVPALVPAVPAFSLITFLESHSALLSGLLVAILDLVFAVNPSANAPDGLLHILYLLITTGKLTQTPPSA